VHNMMGKKLDTLAAIGDEPVYIIGPDNLPTLFSKGIKQ